MNVDLQALAGPRDRLMVDGAVDPVTAEVIRGTMETVCFEMAMYVTRTATTPILNQSNERNATILDGKGRLAALSVGIPQFMLTSTLPVRFALDFLGVDEFHQGDVFVANDPYHGGGHLPDYNVFAPVVVDGHLVLIASIQCHHGDTGGAVPGGYNVTATDIWGEGVRWPVIKVLDRGVERRDVLYALQVNNRLDGYLGDIRAQIGAAKQAADNLVGLVERYGVDMIESAVDHMIDYAAKRFAEEVSAWPDGVYEGDAYVDHDPLGNPDIHLHVRITVDGPKLTIDYTGSDERQELQSWSTYGNTRGYTVAQIAAMMDPEIPKNEGFFNSIELIVPQGCVMNPTPGNRCRRGRTTPAPTSARSSPSRCRVSCPSGRCPRPTRPGSRRPSGASTPAAGRCSSTGQPRSMPAGATLPRAWTPGAPYRRRSGTCGRRRPRSTSRSTRTSSGAVTTARTRAARGSGAAGVARTTSRRCGSRRTSTPTWSGRSTPCRDRRRASGAPNRLTLRYGSDRALVVEHTADWVPMEAGDKINFDYGGGGGWGDPLERPPAAVLDDVLDEYVSVEGARRDYGVVLAGSLEDLTLAVDAAATEARRAEMRAERSARGLSVPARVEDPGASVMIGP